MKIESKKVKVEARIEEVFDFLADMRNFEMLLPEGKFSDWDAGVEYCSFRISGGYTIGMQKQQQTPHDHLLIHSTDAAPFPFTLDIHLESYFEYTMAYQVVDASVNPFVKMMVEKPLANLFDHIADELSTHFQS